MRRVFSVLVMVVIGAAVAHAAPPHPWAMKRANPARTSISTYAGPTKGVLEWKYETGGQVPGLAVDRDGHIFAGATFNEFYWSNEMYVTALNSNGTVYWRTKVTPYTWGASQGVNSWPAINEDGSIVFNSTNGEVRKFTNGGLSVWTVPRSSSSTNDSAPGIFPDGSIAQYQHIGGVRKMTESGATIWQAGVFSQSDVAIAPNNDVAIGGVRTNEPHGSVDVSYLNANGTVRWSRNSTNGANFQAMFGPDGTLYYYGMSALNPANGAPLWSISGPRALAMNSTGTVVYGVLSTTLYAINASNGSTIWTKNLGRTLVQELAVDSVGNIYATSVDGYFGAVTSSGLQLWMVPICFSFKTGPVIGTNGQAYASGRDTQYGDYHVYCIR